MVELSIIVLNYNTKDLTIKCLESINKQYSEQLKSGEFEVIVVDNNSTDGSIEAIQSSKFKVQNNSLKLKIIKNDKNVGFSKGNNIGAQAAKGKYLFFLNSDTEIQDRSLSGMVHFLEKNEKVGVLGAKLKNVDGTNQKSVGKFYNIINVFLMLMGGERLGMLRFSPQKISKVDWVSGAALMIKHELYKRLGGFDEKFFMYLEDMELCFRVKKAGYKVFFYPEINIIHKELGSSNKTFAIVNIYKGLIYFYSKHFNFLQYAFLKFLLFSKAFTLIFIGMITNNNYLKNTYIKAIK